MLEGARKTLLSLLAPHLAHSSSREAEIRGDEAAQQCGWLKDRFGVSWRVVPAIVPELLGDPESEKSQRAMTAMLQMKKPDIEAMKRAYDGA